MTPKVLIGCAVALAVGSVATASLAGPAGTGLTFTEEVARQRVKARTLAVATAAQGCGAEVLAGLEQRPEVARVRQRERAVHVTFRTEQAAAEQGEAVRALLGASCAAPASS